MSQGPDAIFGCTKTATNKRAGRLLAQVIAGARRSLKFYEMQDPFDLCSVGSIQH